VGNDNMGAFKMLSSPWIVTLMNNHGEKLAIGQDGWVIDHKLSKQGGNIVLTVSHTTSQNVMDDFGVGDTIRIQTQQGSTVTQHEVVYTTRNTIEIKGDVQLSNELIGAWIMNASRQACLFIEVNVKNDA